MDLTVYVDNIPLPGETVIGCDLSISPGGKGANQAIAAALSGVDVSMVGCIGDDKFGPSLLNNCNYSGR
ncbi:MAG: hypothetical protein JXA42_16120 [Anaerolineales bacterium]|nr:hypothetical protein [Anaerolineales bacterium]